MRTSPPPPDEAKALDMTGTPPAVSALALRQQAETILREKAEQSLEELKAMSPEAVRQTLHELGVHQIELELQNEELRRSQVALDASRQRFFDLYDLAPVGYVTISESGLILESNLMAASLLGAVRGALARQPFSRFVFKADQDIWYLHRKQLFATGEPQSHELRMVKDDGIPFWVHLASVVAQDAAGAPVCRVTLSDITERKQVEEALRSSDTRHGKMVANIGDVIVIIDQDGINRYKSPNVEKLFGWSPGELVGVGTLENVHPDDLDFVRKVLGALLGKPDATATMECRYRCKDGSYRWIEFTGVNLLHDPDIRGLLGNYRDITVRKRAEVEKAEQEEKNRQLQKSESLGRMAGAIAHHFNNQLQAVMLYLEMAKSHRPENGGPVAGVFEAIQATRKAAEVSSLMLTYLGQSEAKHEPLDLSATCRQNLALLRVAMPPHVGLETDLPSPGPVISADANRILQVLTNLVTNAWEVCGEGRGPVRLAVKTVTAAEISSAHRFPIDFQPQAQAYACLEVADMGGGIVTKEIEELFEPFFSTKSLGRGLGLAVVLGLARSHDGVVTVENHPGRGCAFRVFFPVSVEAVLPKPVREVSTGEPVRRGATVLVVEDDENLRETFALTLKVFDFSVLTAEDGVAALDLFRQHRGEIGCVLCDVVMPRMNGWETLTALRQLAPDLPVILLSGYSEAEAKAGNHPDQPQAFLRKPCEVRVLINAIKQVLAVRKD